MAVLEIEKNIKASPERVFQTIADINKFSEAVPNITNVEFLSDQKTGVGTRFRETRKFNNQESTTELEVTEYQPNQSIRIVSDSGGTIWDSFFEVHDHQEYTQLTLTMESRPHKWWAYFLNFVMSPIIRKAINQDMESVKTYCETF